MIRKRKIVITGASGFIGSNLVPLLLKKHYQITVLDQRGASYPKSVKVVHGNLLTGEGLDEFLEGSDILIHLAGQVLPGVTTMEEGNTKTTRNLVLKAEQYKVKKIIFASSVAVYGNSKTKIFKETDKCNPDTDYGLSKFKAEKIVEKWGKKKGSQYAILRFFSLYGYGNKKGLIYNLCTDFINTGSVIINGDGTQERDLVWVDDAVDTITLACETDFKGTYNIGTGINYSLLELISILEKVSGKKCNIIFKKKDNNKVGSIFYSSKKISKETGWKPQMTAVEGVGLVYKYILNAKTHRD